MSSGISLMQGAHQVAQKFNNKTLFSAFDIVFSTSLISLTKKVSTFFGSLINSC